MPRSVDVIATMCQVQRCTWRNDRSHREADSPGMDLRRVVTARREALGCSQNEIARRADIDQGAFSRMLNGKVPVHLDDLEAIAAALEWPVWRLVIEADSDRADPKLGAWIAFFETLSPERRDSALRFLAPSPPEQNSA